MGLYERIWKDEKNRTLLISSIIVLAALIIAIIFASWDKTNAPKWLTGLYFEPPGSEFSVGLTIIIAVLVALFYFFLLIALATFSEIRANLPSWGSFVSSGVISFLVTWIITALRPGQAQYSNFTTSMQWTVFGVLIVVFILSIIYIFLTEKPDEEDKKK